MSIGGIRVPFTLRQKLGAAFFDWPRYEWNLRGFALPGRPPGHWTWIANRQDELRSAPEGCGVQRVGRWTSRLHGSAVYPSLGRRLMRRSLDEWPVELSSEPAPEGNSPDLSFVIGHRGAERVPSLQMVLRSIAAQQDVSIECLVVEQSERSDLDGLLPSWVRHVRTPPPDATMPYSRSWALNVGARLARGRLLVFHDGDMLVPSGYAGELLTAYGRGYEVVNVKRFIYYLSREQTTATLSSGRPVLEGRLDAIAQNLQAGGSVAVDRQAFLELGGFDEGFIGWGGEDDEFWDRASSRRLWSWGYLPILHLWHAPQPEKGSRDRSTAERLRERSAIPIEDRIQELGARDFGLLRGPAGLLSGRGADGT